jgi:hypothetical protein
MTAMDVYETLYEQNMRYNEAQKNKKNQEQEEAPPSSATRKARRLDSGESLLSEFQIQQLRGKYNLRNMTYEEEEMFLLDLTELGALTKEDCGSFFKTEGNIFDALTKQINSDINLLYQMAIAGRSGSQHIEHIKSQQKLLDVLELLMVE